MTHVDKRTRSRPELRRNGRKRPFLRFAEKRKTGRKSVFFFKKKQIFGPFSAIWQNVKTRPFLRNSCRDQVCCQCGSFFLVARTVPPSLVDHGPKSVVLLLASGTGLKSKIRPGGQKTSHQAAKRPLTRKRKISRVISFIGDLWSNWVRSVRAKKWRFYRCSIKNTETLAENAFLFVSIYRIKFGRWWVLILIFRIIKKKTLEFVEYMLHDSPYQNQQNDLDL